MIKLSALAIIFLVLVSTATTAIVPGTYFDRFFFIIFENTNFDAATQNSYLKSLISRNNSVFLSSYSGIAHPSQPNYISTIYGSTAGITDDGVHDVDGNNLIDLLEAKGISWKAYMQDYPGNCFTGAKSGLYVRKHNPFISMTDISSNSARCANIVNADGIDTDLASQEGLPQFSYYVPNLQNDGHDTGLDFAMNWFQPWFEERLKNPNFANGTLFFITFDEDETLSNHIFSSLLGTPVTSGTHEDTTQYTHNSVLKTLIDNWNLGSLGRNDVNATAFTQFLQHP
ncbi:3250_t:CDS:2 [Paraglomus occultum]|uniref:3250_t:CDS:1 n=1 Tax=Paraglomus occultum TaxID=144539 RepID=A0A9N9CDK8_9GLOM|nr:3250_t:CDS:2 [Paraglomus occultum]